MKSITYTLIDRDTNTIELASWVIEKRRADCYMMASEALNIARDLKEGKTWKPVYYTLSEPMAQGPCSILIEDPEQDKRDAELAEDARYFGLLERGAAGDAEAAIEYCQALLAGSTTYGVAYA